MSSKVNSPGSNGTSGQVLTTNGNGTTSWTTPLAVDNTLSQTGKAADAKKVGDEITELKDDLSDITEVASSTTFFDFQANWASMTVGLIDTSNGNIISDSGTGARVSDYLPVTAGTTYLIKMTNRVAYYSTSKSFISSVPDTYSQPQPWTPEANGYVRLNTVPANVQTAEAVIVGEMSAIDLVARELLDEITEVISSDRTLYDFTANWSQMTVGLLQNDGSIGSDAGTGAKVSDYIPVTEGTTYTGKNINRTAFYNSSKVYTSADIGSKFWTGDPWTAPADGYLRLNLTPANVPVAEATIVGAESLTAIDKVAREAIGQSIEGLDEVIVIAETLFDFQTNWSQMTSGLIQPDGSIGSDAGTGAKVSDYVAVQSGVTYVLSGINRAAFYNSSKSYIKALSGIYYGAEFIPEQDGYVRLNITPSNLPIAKADIGISTAIDNIARKDIVAIKNELHMDGDCYSKVSGDLSSGASLTVTAVNNIKKNNVYSFSGKITSFSSLQIGHGTTNLYDSYIEITGTNVVVHNRLATDETVTYAHGLNISSYIKVEIQVKDFGTTSGYMDCDITVLSGGSAFRQENVKWLGCGKGNIFVKSVGSSLTECKLTWTSNDLRKKIWIFGDSYIMIPESSRWPYYAHLDGYINNFLLNGFGGENSTDAVQALQAMIEAYGSPRYIVWILGMNDGSDGSSSGTYPTSWFTAMGTLFTLCTNHGITPILATIPSIPNIKHEEKNTYVRATGYKYIDFAKAVGASSSGQWYTGMLSSDNTHPTELGAKALYNQVLIDFPEITY